MLFLEPAEHRNALQTPASTRLVGWMLYKYRRVMASLKKTGYSRWAENMEVVVPEDSKGHVEVENGDRNCIRATPLPKRTG
jgi:hypothetical protein